MLHKHKEFLCRLAIKILNKYNVCYSHTLKYSYVEVNGKYYVIHSIKIGEEDLEFKAAKLNTLIDRAHERTMKF